MEWLLSRTVSCPLFFFGVRFWFLPLGVKNMFFSLNHDRPQVKNIFFLAANKFAAVSLFRGAEKMSRKRHVEMDTLNLW